MSNNARFWEYCGDSWVKITLRPGQQLHHSRGGLTEEGYHWATTTWEHAYDRVVQVDVTQARDCDGRFDTYAEYTCPLEELNSKLWDPSPSGAIPNWQRDNSHQRDYSAEAAGY